MELIFEKSKPGRRASSLPRLELPLPPIPDELRRAEEPRLPEISEPELVRHFTALADRTFGVDTGFYPLGSCTMKHNPRVNERVVSLPGFRDLHPHQEEEAAQGALELMRRLQEILAEVAGLPAVTLQPAAGSQGELTGLMLMRAYFADRGEADRRRKVRLRDRRRSPSALRFLVDQLHARARTSASRSRSPGVRFSVTQTSNVSSSPS